MPARTRQVVVPLCCLLALVPRTASGQSPLFQDAAPLTLRLEGDFKGLFRDRGEERAEHPALLRFSSGTDSASVKVDLRTRGIFRLKNCSFPPIRFDLPTGKVTVTSEVPLDPDAVKAAVDEAGYQLVG